MFGIVKKPAKESNIPNRICDTDNSDCSNQKSVAYFCLQKNNMGTPQATASHETKSTLYQRPNAAQM
jgi:hypothetical protein